MAIDADAYESRLATLQKDVLEILRTFEFLQENLRPGTLHENQARLVSAVGATFRSFESNFATMMPPDAMKEIHQPVCTAIRELSKASDLFMSKPGPEWTLAFLHSRAAFCGALYQLYDLRDELPIIAAHFLLAGATAPVANPSSGAATGFFQRKRNDDCSDSTLYIPEDYSPERPLPLIIALHGGYGQGSEYVWTWLRIARSRGYAILAPKSWDNTWDMSVPSEDTRSILRMLDEVMSKYSIDASRIYLTGLSDGGIFTYIFGLEQHHLFRGLAPIAGALHPVVDPMLRRGLGKDTPLFVVHGVHDFIFPVAFTRQTCKLLNDIGYNIKYEELPEWGHAYPYSINERMVLPWFEALPPKK
jgi:predicted esterase